MPPALPHVDGVEHLDVVVRGLRLHVAAAGPANGPPVVLQHGWPEHWYEWRNLIGPLADAGHRVLAPDFRGFGWSAHPADGDFRKETLVDDLVDLCAELGHRRISFVGHDWGCWVGWLLCLRRPDLVERAVLLGVRAPFPVAVSPKALARLVNLSYQVPISAPLPHAVKAPLLERMRPFVVRQGMPPDAFDAYWEPLRQPEQVRATTLLYRQFLTRELPSLAGGRYRDARVTVPVRFLIGGDSPLHYEGLEHEPAAQVDDYAGEAVPGVGHFIPEAAPELLRDRVLGFLGAREPQEKGAAPR